MARFLCAYGRPLVVQVSIAACRRADVQASKPTMLRSTEEVAEVIERDVEEHLVRSPAILGKGLKLEGRQLILSSGRIDLLFRDMRGHLLLVEVKLGRIGRDAVAQTERYLAEFRATQRTSVRAAIVCGGVMPAFEDDIRKKRSIRIYKYGWELRLQDWRNGSA